MWNNLYPYLSLPVLKAYLKQKGHSVEQWDINADFNNKILSENYLVECCSKIERELFKLDKTKNPKEFRKAEKEYLIAKFVTENINDSIEIMKSEEDFYNPKKMSDAQSVINIAYRVVANAHNGLKEIKGFNLVYEDEANYSSKKIFSLINDPEKNFLIDYYKKNVLKKILEKNPDMIGMSVTGYSQLIPALTLASLIKEKNKNIHITIGGNAVTRIAENLVLHKNYFDVVDSAITHEGELPLHFLINSLKNKKDLTSVPNLIYRENNEIITNPKTKPEKISDLPAPDFEEYKSEDYLAPVLSLPFYATRGCYWNRCTFCDHSLIYDNNYVQKQAQKIVDELEHLSKTYSVKHFHFHDECISPALCKKISDEIVVRNLEIYWSLNARIEKQFSREVTDQMYNAGCRLVSIGVESFNDQTLNRMDKGSTVQRIKEIVKNFSDSKILTHGFIIVGFPGETFADVSDTINFIKENEDILHYVGVSTFTLNIKSKIATNFLNYPISNLHSIAEYDLNPELIYSVNDGMKKEEVQKLYNDLNNSLIKGNNDYLYNLKSRINLFLYVSRFTEKTDIKNLNKGPDFSINNLENSKYKLMMGIYSGAELPGEGIPIYNFLKKNKITTKDKLLCEILDSLSFSDEYSVDEVLRNLSEKIIDKSSVQEIGKVKFYLDYLEKKEMITSSGEIV